MRAFRRTHLVAALLIGLVVATLAAPNALAARATANRTKGTPTTTVDRGAYRLDWSSAADMSGAAPLSGATITVNPVWVRMAIVTAPSVGISSVKWYANGAAVRDNDTAAPYDLKYDGWTFPDGPSSVKAVVLFTDGVTAEVSAAFRVSTSSSSPPPPTTVDRGSYRLDWSSAADMSGAAPLNGATVTVNPVWVRMAVVTAPSVGIGSVSWFANGAAVRDNDTSAPYDLKYDGWTFPDGPSSVKAVVNFTDGATAEVNAAFQVATSSSSPRPPTGSLPFPGPGTVGHLADLPGYHTPVTNLVERAGDFTTSYDGQVVEGLHVNGAVLVKNRNVIVRNNRVEFGVWVVPDSTHPNVSARVEWNTIGSVYGTESTYVGGNGRGENVHYYRNEMFGGIDLFNFNKSGNVTIEENWAYGAYQKLQDPYQTSVSHCDGIQVFAAGAHYKILRNRFDLFLFRGYEWSADGTRQVQISPRPTAKSNIGKFQNIAPMTTGFLFQQGAGQLDDIVFDGNRIDGDYYRVMSFPKNQAAQGPTNVKIVNNTFVRRTATFGRNQFIGADTPGNIVFSNNKDQTGAQIALPAGMLAA